VAVSNPILTYVTSVVEMAPFNNLRDPHSLNNQPSFVLQLPAVLTPKHAWDDQNIMCDVKDSG
jgi:hypothetical protein